MLLEHFDKISLAGIRFPVLLLISRHATHELVLGIERRCETRLEWESVREYYFRIYEFDGNSACRGDGLVKFLVRAVMGIV